MNYLFILLVGGLFLFFQYYLHKWFVNRPKPIYLLSKQLLKQAMEAPKESYQQLHLVEKAFWARLWEKEIITSGSFSWEFIPEDKNLKSVYSFLNQLQAWQYGPNKDVDPQWKEKMKSLFNSLT
ncbi:MAG: hypothetical protein Q8K60_05905 [Parachlamydiaceae bacterium]|nr:hypothetical protein [Parachlamydiaceae bacterium]